MAVAHVVAALVTAYIPLRLGCTALVYCRESGPSCQPNRWSRAVDWISRHPHLFPVGGRFLAGPAALCLVSVAAGGAAGLFL